MVFVSRKQGARASVFVISPKMAGILVVIGVMAVPGVPSGYLTPVAVFFGAFTVFLMESRKYRGAHRPNGVRDSGQEKASEDTD